MNRSRCLKQLAAAVTTAAFDHPVRVAIDGVDGSGKTTLADELADRVVPTRRQIIRASVDGFHNPQAVRHARSADSPEGYFLDSFDYGALKELLLEPLGPGGDREYRTSVFDYRSDQSVAAARQRAKDDAILLFDGVFLLRPELDGLWDLTIWVDAPFELTVERAVARDARTAADAAALRARYARRYVPGQQLYIEQCRPQSRADIVFDNSTFDHPTVRLRHPKTADSPVGGMDGK